MSTTATASAAPASPRTQARGFLLSRLGSLFSILPLGVWTLNHLWNNLAAWTGGREWQQAVTGHPSVASQALVAALVVGPLLWHTAWGFSRMLRSKPALHPGYFSNLRYNLQRLSALGLLGFLGAHLWLAWIQPRFLEGEAEPFREIASEMRHHAPTTIVYVLGILAISYHLANGLWSLGMSWGFTVSKASQTWLERLALLAFVVFLVIGFSAVGGLYAAGGAYRAVAH